MPQGQLPERPAFSTNEPGLESSSLPTSRLAVLALLLGTVSLLTALSLKLLPLAVISALFSIGVILLLSRKTTSVGGIRLAQIGLCFAVLGTSCVFVATQLRDKYLYSVAGEHAQIYLQKITNGRIYEAYELRRPAHERQLTGTNLEAHYRGLPDGEERSKSNEYLSSPEVRKVVNAGTDAKWHFVKGVRVQSLKGNRNWITVQMANSINENTVSIQLERIIRELKSDGNYATEWFVIGENVPNKQL